MQVREIKKKLGELYHSDEVIMELAARLGDHAAVSPLGGRPSFQKIRSLFREAKVAGGKNGLGLIGTDTALTQLKKLFYKYDLQVSILYLLNLNTSLKMPLLMNFCVKI
ncbi:MAG: hypothetical protein KIT56_08670 [Gammaproteobacteria bacterium]|nr:hypothetical protein [Gammaproteobacteria bacterium]